ncbi:helix-turn-helix domain-containing protein [Mucilaginibacter sp. FT3.2]|uniref:helix-turn-helix domain-containing protein n=1 Tax=Mucilaginibacter sp. FT3.2 TaxID=2723090 RepID=UPI00161A58C9|nr:helix-turn-helix transcriptional regulator [Mucilaginibacter sp. FT3.2]MBB6234205.1 transcriptional regulator with XRE-family HTH domain [Mucilaginibacter sp. FT3.2]
MTTGTKIRLLREQHRWDQGVVADSLGVTQPAVSKLESDQTKLSWENAVKLAKLFDVDPEYFFEIAINNFNNHAYSVNQVQGTYQYTDVETIKMLYEEKLQAKEELLHERFLRNNELKEQVAELKKEIAELRKQVK